MILFTRCSLAGLAPPRAARQPGAATLGGKRQRAGEVEGVEVYDPATDTWDAVAPMPTARGFLAAAVVGGKLLILI